MKSFFADVKIFIFRPKTMDYNKAFWPKFSSFFVVFILRDGRCYEDEICTILLFFRSPFQWYVYWNPQTQITYGNFSTLHGICTNAESLHVNLLTFLS